jgi:large subunit ribosomal protein L10
MKVTKNILIKKALEKSKKKNITKLADHLTGSNILLFTKMNPFKLSLLLAKNKMKMKAKGGDTAQDDIVIPSGNTGLPPGPAISELHDIGIRTRIEAGSVWVSQDTALVKKGDTIDPKVASVLTKLGVKPLEVGLQIIAAYDEGSILTNEQLTLDLEEIKNQFNIAHRQTLNLSINMAYPTTETIARILQRAYLEARNLAINSTYLTSDVAVDLLTRAHLHMYNLSLQLAKINKDAAPKQFQE